MKMGELIDKGRPMILIRIAFWLVILILLLPTSKQEQMAVYGTAESAVKDISSFCDRNPSTCETGAAAFDTFTQKAKFGVKMVTDFVKGTKSDEAAERLASTENGIGDSQSTLTPGDIEPVW
jgi:hypothetical protein